MSQRLQSLQVLNGTMSHSTVVEACSPKHAAWSLAPCCQNISQQCYCDTVTRQEELADTS